VHKLIAFTKLFWPEGGGAELATYTVVRDILSKYFDVTVVSGTKSPAPDVLKCCRYLYWEALRPRLKPVVWLKTFAGSNAIRKIVKEADVVYISSHSLLPLAAVAKAVRPDIKVVVHLHDFQPLTFTSVVLAERGPGLTTDVVVELGESGSLLRAVASGFGHYANALNRVALLHADSVICVSRRQCEILEKHAPEVRGKAAVVYNPLPPMPDVEKRPDEVPTVLYIGGGSFIKGFHIAVKTLAKVLASHNARAYVIAGRSVRPEQARLLEKLSKKFGERFVVLGRIPWEELLRLYSRAWALLFPSINEEPLPYAVLEAAAMGTIPVAFRVGGVPEVVEGTSAEKFLCEVADVGCLSEKIEDIFGMSREKLVDMAIEIEESVKGRFDLESVTSKMLKAFKRINV